MREGYRTTFRCPRSSPQTLCDDSICCDSARMCPSWHRRRSTPSSSRSKSTTSQPTHTRARTAKHVDVAHHSPPDTSTILKEMDADLNLFSADVLQNVVNVVFSRNYDQGPLPPRHQRCPLPCLPCSYVQCLCVRCAGINLGLELAKRFNRADRWAEFIPIAASILSPSIFEVRAWLSCVLCALHSRTRWLFHMH
jgi:hypothetical protein